MKTLHEYICQRYLERKPINATRFYGTHSTKLISMKPVSLKARFHESHVRETRFVETDRLCGNERRPLDRQDRMCHV
jgi:hypothetical protein